MIVLTRSNVLLNNRAVLLFPFGRCQRIHQLGLSIPRNIAQDFQFWFLPDLHGRPFLWLSSCYCLDSHTQLLKLSFDIALVRFQLFRLLDNGSAFGFNRHSFCTDQVLRFKSLNLSLPAFPDSICQAGFIQHLISRNNYSHFISHAQQQESSFGRFNRALPYELI